MQIQWLAIIVGGAASFLFSAFAALLSWPVLFILGSETPTNSSIVFGVLIGTLLGGFMAGRQSPRPAFHGALTGLLFVGAVGIVAISSGSPAPISTISTFFALGAGLGAIGGYMALRRMRARTARRSAD
jgi:putative membrane protein (TIGR04086 family)